MRHGTGDGRGRHRRRNSPEAKAWLELERDPGSLLHLPDEPGRNRHGIPKLPGPAPDAKDAEPPVEAEPKKPKPPARPDWMTDATYDRLVDLREQL